MILFGMYHKEYRPMKYKNKTLSCLNVTRWLINIESSTVKTISNSYGIAYYVQYTKYSVFSVVNFPTKPHAYMYNVFFFAMVLVTYL